MRLLLLSALRGYHRWLSPAFGPSCRFTPSCSTFALEAITRYGALKGSWLALKRLTCCHPYHAGGYDPVP